MPAEIERRNGQLADRSFRKGRSRWKQLARTAVASVCWGLVGRPNPGVHLMSDKSFRVRHVPVRWAES